MTSADVSKDAVAEVESLLKNKVRKKLESEVEKWKKHSSTLRISTDDFKQAADEAESLFKKELGKKLEMEFAKPQHEIQHLPNETLQHILQFLSPKDLNNVSVVS